MVTTSSVVVVADSSPLIHLGRISRLEVLRRLYARVVVPPAVWLEVTTTRPEAPGAMDVREAVWIERVAPANVRHHALTAKASLGEGEREALSLATETKNSLLLIDERPARLLASQLGIPHIGTLGVLKEAKTAGVIDVVRPDVERLRSQGMRIDDLIVDAFLKDVGE